MQVDAAMIETKAKLVVLTIIGESSTAIADNKMLLIIRPSLEHIWPAG